MAHRCKCGNPIEKPFQELCVICLETKYPQARLDAFAKNDDAGTPIPNQELPKIKPKYAIMEG